MQFANPALLFGALLFAVPLIIHLLNRRRHRVRRWAAMEFLLRAYQKQRRRLRRENLLLLLLRCLIPILLALAIARPTLHDGSRLPGLEQSTAHHVFVFDASYSMGVDAAGTTPFERSKQLATMMVDGLDGRSGQKVSIVVAGVQPRMPLREDLALGRAKDRIAALGNPTDGASDLTPALLQVADLIDETEDSRANVYLFTDLQVRAFGDDPFATDDPAETRTAPPADTEPTPEMFRDTAVDAIRRIQDAGDLTVFDMRGALGDSHDNVQVTGIEIDSPHAIAKAPVRVRAQVLNRSNQTRTVQATLEIDGGQPQRGSTELDAGAEGEIAFQVTFRELGQRRVTVRIDGDDLATDDVRYRVLPVRERLRVLLVEGSGEDEPELRESTHVGRILDPTRGEGSADLAPFELATVDAVTFLSGRTRLDEFEVIVLANLPQMTETAARALEVAVESGAGLLTMFGSGIDIGSYNLHLHRAGDGLIPLLLLEPTGYAPGGDRYFGSEVRDPDHPMFADFPEPVFFEIFESLPVYRYVRSEPATRPASDEGSSTPVPADEVVVSVRDPARSPLVATRRYGLGKTVTLTSTLSRRFDRWNGLDFEVTAFPWLHRMAHWLATPTLDSFNVEVGSSLTALTNSRPYELAVVLPERAGSAKVPIGEDAEPRLGGRYALPPFARTEYAGFYEFEMLRDFGGATERDALSFAVNPAAAEGDLRYYTHPAARDRLGIERIVTDLPADGEAAIQAGFQDLGQLFLWLTLAALVGEAALARFVSRRRS